MSTTSTRLSTRPADAVANARQLLHATVRGGEWREMVYAEIVQLNRFIREGQERLVVATSDDVRTQTHTLVDQLISARVDLERALSGPSVDDWNPAILTGKPADKTKLSPAKSGGPSGGVLVALIIGLGTIVAVLGCAIAGALGLFGVVSVTGLPTIVDVPGVTEGFQIPGLGQAPPTAIPVSTFAPPVVYGAASIDQPNPDAPPPAPDASRNLVGVMPTPVPVTIVPTAEQPTAVPVVPTLEPPPIETPIVPAPDAPVDGGPVPTPMP